MGLKVPFAVMGHNFLFMHLCSCTMSYVQDLLLQSSNLADLCILLRKRILTATLNLPNFQDMES